LPPPRVVENDAFVEQFGDGVAEVTKMTGVERRYYVEEGVTTSDMCFAAANRLMDKLGWERDSVDGFIFVTQSPDYRCRRPLACCRTGSACRLTPSRST
jgi:3-oxoacyl-[acyl-carrier-protein] synthase-3